MLDQEIRTLEEIGARTWPAREVVWLGGWLVSIDQGLTRRANSVLPLSWDERAAIGDRIATVERRYRDRGLQPCFKLTRAARPSGLDELLDRRGYCREGDSLVLTRTGHRVDTPDGVTVNLSSEPTPGWLDCARPDGNDDDRWLGIVSRIRGPRAFAHAHLESQPAGGALAAVERHWCCLTALHVQPASRRRGVARALIAALSAWASPQVAALFLQVESDNESALRLYASVGFQVSYRYHYRTLAI